MDAKQEVETSDNPLYVDTAAKPTASAKPQKISPRRMRSSVASGAARHEDRRFRALGNVEIHSASFLGARDVGVVEKGEVVRVLEAREVHDTLSNFVLRMRIDRGWITAKANNGAGDPVGEAALLDLEAVAPEPFQLTLKSGSSGEALTLEVDGDMLLQELKEAVCEQVPETEGIQDVDSLQLSLDGAALEDEVATVEELGLTSEAAVTFAAQPAEAAAERRLAREDARRVAAEERKTAEEEERAEMARTHHFRSALVGLAAVAALLIIYFTNVYYTQGCGGHASCGAHGRCVGLLHDFGLASSLCECDPNWLGDLCELGPFEEWRNETVAAQCVAGMGSNGVVYKGTAYRTLDDASADGGNRGEPNEGCQRSDFWQTNQPNYLPLPPGYVLAPNDADTIAVIASHGWSTPALVLADDSAVCSGSWARAGGPGGSCGSGNQSVTSADGSMYTTRECFRRLLARCP